MHGEACGDEPWMRLDSSGCPSCALCPQRFNQRGSNGRLVKKRILNGVYLCQPLLKNCQERWPAEVVLLVMKTPATSAECRSTIGTTIPLTPLANSHSLLMRAIVNPFPK